MKDALAQKRTRASFTSMFVSGFTLFRVFSLMRALSRVFVDENGDFLLFLVVYGGLDVVLGKLGTHMIF